MNELIKIDYDRQTTSARDLWEFLSRPYRDFNPWFDKYKEYGFTENQDFRALTVKIVTAQGNEVEAQDYEITVDMAKELAMLQKTDKGKQARQYFITIEKQWNSPEAIMARALKVADLKILECKNTILQLEAKVEADKPLVDFASKVGSSQNSLLVREVAKLACKQGINIGEKRLWEKLREWGLIFKKSTEPIQEYVDRGIFEVVEGVHENSKGSFVHKTTRVTGKGQIYIIDRLKKETKN